MDHARPVQYTGPGDGVGFSWWAEGLTDPSVEKFFTVFENWGLLAGRQVTNYRDETALPNPEEAELLAKGTGESCSIAPYGSMHH